ncbi:uncharacterized protein LOC115918211 [Strongylocentrotus purpuratus]|uniref:Protein quiver n=1 Tax=Strongylocentrotus purpuratus TaxID=7668 RepID=A0A7M7ND32_STRPU|nr:uncharacterized protein LOC115918211 [Strongylocentrotus purpuratus]
MKSFIIGVCLLACLSFEIGQALECYSCGSFEYQSVDLGTCGADTLAKTTCETNTTKCAKVELAGNLDGALSSETFTFTLRGCTDVAATTSMDGCSKESAKADEILEDVGVVGFSQAQYDLFKLATGTNPTYSSVAACTCTDELCNSAGGLQASFVVISVSLVMAVFAKVM